MAVNELSSVLTCQCHKKVRPSISPSPSYHPPFNFRIVRICGGNCDVLVNECSLHQPASKHQKNWHLVTTYLEICPRTDVLIVKWIRTDNKIFLIRLTRRVVPIGPHRSIDQDILWTPSRAERVRRDKVNIGGNLAPLRFFRCTETHSVLLPEIAAV